MSVCPPPPTLFSFCRCVTFLLAACSTFHPCGLLCLQKASFFFLARESLPVGAGIVSYLLPSSYSCQVSNQQNTQKKHWTDLSGTRAKSRKKADIIVLTTERRKQDSKVDRSLYNKERKQRYRTSVLYYCTVLITRKVLPTYSIRYSKNKTFALK